MIELQGEIDTSTITVQHFNTLLSITDISSRHRIIRDEVELKSIINYVDLMDLCRILHQNSSIFKKRKEKWQSRG